jgi:hypothetical protein
MFTKTKVSIAVIAFFAMTAIASIVWYASRPQGQASAGNSINVFQESNPISENPVASDQSGYPFSSTVNETTVSVEFARIIESGVEIGVCYPTPDAGDWYPTPGSITYGTNEIHPDEFEFTSENKADGANPGTRCVTIRYQVEDVESIKTPIKFTLLGFWAVPREGSPCADFQTRFDTNWKARTATLNATCTENENGDISTTLLSHDTSITSEEAQALLDEIVKGEVNGPWEFTIAELTK